MRDIFGHCKQNQEWTVQVTYPRTMRPQHSKTFCSWWKKLGATLCSSSVGTDTKDDDGEVLIEQFRFPSFEDAERFCQYTCSQLDKWSGPGAERRYTVKVRGQVKFKDRTEGWVGANHPGGRRGE